MADSLHRQWFQKGIGDKPADFADTFFIYELEFQCEFGLRSFGEMQRAYATDTQHPALIALAHSLLVFAGNVGKILEAPGNASPRVRARAKRLRKTLGLEDANFDQIRRARNFFEHFDERIDRYVGNHKGLLIHRRVQDHCPTSVELDDGRVLAPSFLQFFNTTTLELILYDQRFQLSEIVKLLEVVQAKAENWREACIQSKVAR